MYEDKIFSWAHSRIKRRHPEWNKICPHCKRKSFSPLIDIRTENPVDDKHCGICDHQSSCGYKMNYTEWKEKYGPRQEWIPREQWIEKQRQLEREAEQIRRKLAEEKANSFDPFKEVQPPKVQAYLYRMSELCKQMQVHNNTLVDYLYTIAPKEQVDEVLNRYRIGSTAKREVIYWQIDWKWRVHTGKIMDYSPDGHRIKTKGANWVHCQDNTGLATKEQLAPQCLFGEHLIGEFLANHLNEGKKIQIVLVEGEKTAIILNIVIPEVIWLATGGKDNFNEKILQSIAIFDVIVLPDADALDNWSKKIATINPKGYKLRIPPRYISMCTPEARERKMDLADMILEGLGLHTERVRKR